ncbi:MAG TPA: chorismate pyruvate-lyase family protein [Burkholderiaceae bacterium]|nr:chorismate pyruvate-lyase family protein [Burkholderiaceae bacterium]
MSSQSSKPLVRERFAATPHAAEQRLLTVLLAQDGSTTRLCEAIAQGPIKLHVYRQHVTHEVPALVREYLPGKQFIERITSLVAHDRVLMDNLSYIALEGLEPDIEADLRAGTMPIGHMLSRWWVRRERIADFIDLAQRLWEAVGLPDLAATRAYRIVTPEAPRMVIVETYRRGMVA